MSSSFAETGSLFAGGGMTGARRGHHFNLGPAFAGCSSPGPHAPPDSDQDVRQATEAESNVVPRGAFACSEQFGRTHRWVAAFHRDERHAKSTDRFRWMF